MSLTFKCCQFNCLATIPIGIVREVRIQNELSTRRQNDKINTKAEGALMWQKLIDISSQAASFYNSRTWRFVINNNKVCLRAWAIVNGWKTSRIYQFATRIKHGDRRAYCAGKNMEKLNPETTRARKAQCIIAWLDKYAHEMGDFLPTVDDSGRDSVIHLPFSHKKNVWAEFSFAHRGTQMLVSRSYFLSVWKTYRRKLKKVGYLVI